MSWQCSIVVDFNSPCWLAHVFWIISPHAGHLRRDTSLRCLCSRAQGHSSPAGRAWSVGELPAQGEAIVCSNQHSRTVAIKYTIMSVSNVVATLCLIHFHVVMLDSLVLYHSWFVSDVGWCHSTLRCQSGRPCWVGVSPAGERRWPEQGTPLLCN